MIQKLMKEFMPAEKMIEMFTYKIKSNQPIGEISETILGCGTCLQSRNNKEPQVCKFSSMKDLYELAHRNKIVMTF